MIQTQVQTAEYWESDFSLSDEDLEHIYNSLLDTQQPQTVEALALLTIEERIRRQITEVQRLLESGTVYKPSGTYEVGEELVFPALNLSRGTVQDSRSGFNPEFGSFSVIRVDIDGRSHEFAADLTAPHDLNDDGGSMMAEHLETQVGELSALYAPTVAERIAHSLAGRDDFIRLGSYWFVTSLMADVNIGHLHLAEAILEMSDGGPLTTEEILPQLDLDPGVDEAIQLFSLNQAMLEDGRFDEVSPRQDVAWYLRRMEPDEVREVPERLIYEPVAYDRALLAPQHILLEQEIDDEWSDLEEQPAAPEVIWPLTFPHRWAGTLPLSSRIRALFPRGVSPVHRVVLIVEETADEIPAWVVHDGRYVSGLGDWYQENAIPVGGYLHLRPGPEPGVILLDYERRKAKREWVRLGTINDNILEFDLKRRAIPCSYDDSLIVGTDTIAAIDAHWRKVRQRPLAILLAEIFPSLAALSPQQTAHAKTLYSALNMLRRVPPGPLFAELVRHPAFKAVGHDYWAFDNDIWRENKIGE